MIFKNGNLKAYLLDGKGRCSLMAGGSNNMAISNNWPRTSSGFALKVLVLD